MSTGRGRNGSSVEAASVGSMLWRRLDVPGHDVARLVSTRTGAEIRGMAVFLDAGAPTALKYRVASDSGWHTTGATVDGWRHGQTVDLHIRRTPDLGWSLNGRACPAVAGCVDLDLSFTPATNLLPLRRLRLDVGAKAEVRSAWLEWPKAVLTPLVQRYARRSSDVYGYEAELPGTDPFTATLRVGADGWVLDYADLWRCERPV